jgi:uncharacterized protein YneF (UPF0154 family)
VEQEFDMAAFWKKNDKTTIAELEEYYSNQSKNRQSPKAWFMAILSILITIAIIVGLFFAGRWAYRAIIDNSDDNETTSETAENESDNDVDLPTFDSDELGERGVAFEDSTSDDESDLVQGDLEGSENTDGNQGVVSDEAARTERDVASSTDSSENESETTATELPNTGAGESVMVILFATTAFGYLLARKHLMKGL